MVIIIMKHKRKCVALFRVKLQSRTCRSCKATSQFVSWPLRTPVFSSSANIAQTQHIPYMLLKVGRGD